MNLLEENTGIHQVLFNNGAQGTFSTLVTAAFSFGGTEMIALTASEAASIRALPKAIKQVFWRIVIFYFGSIIMIATLVPYNDKRLLGSSSVDVTASPFTIAIVNGGIKGLPSVINAVILISVLSVGNASVYATSRTLNSLAEQGMAPKWTGYIDRAGRPLFAILITNIFGLFALIATDNDKQVEAFNWLLALSGLSSVFTWLSINVSHLRFRRAMRVQNRSLDELPFIAQSGEWGSYVGSAINVFFLGAQFYVSLFPVGSSPNAYDFFLGYLGFPVIVLSWIGYNIWKTIGHYILKLKILMLILVELILTLMSYNKKKLKKKLDLLKVHFILDFTNSGVKKDFS